jgi:hypothetical protein
MSLSHIALGYLDLLTLRRQRGIRSHGACDQLIFCHSVLEIEIVARRPWLYFLRDEAQGTHCRK